MEDDVSAEEVRQLMAERHFMLSQAVIERYDAMVEFLTEAEQALEASGHASLADRAQDELERTREELEEWRSFRAEVEPYLEGTD